jgi:hypothetical protein
VRLPEICIERPVLTTVMSLSIVLIGAIALQRLPNRELPDVDPPVVAVTTVYLGAAPEVVETSVTQVLEDQLIGIEGIKHVTSISREQVSQISVEFELYRDVDAAAADVRDRVARARSTLPQDVEEPVIASAARTRARSSGSRCTAAGSRRSSSRPWRRRACATGSRSCPASPRSGSRASGATRCASGSTIRASPARP